MRFVCIKQCFLQIINCKCFYLLYCRCVFFEKARSAYSVYSRVRQRTEEDMKISNRRRVAVLHWGIGSAATRRMIGGSIIFIRALSHPAINAWALTRLKPEGLQ